MLGNCLQARSHEADVGLVAIIDGRIECNPQNVGLFQGHARIGRKRQASAGNPFGH